MKKKRRFGDYVVIVLLLSLLGGTFWLYVHNNSKEIPYFYLENNTNRKAAPTIENEVYSKGVLLYDAANTAFRPLA